METSWTYENKKKHFQLFEIGHRERDIVFRWMIIDIAFFVSHVWYLQP